MQCLNRSILQLDINKKKSFDQPAANSNGAGAKSERLIFTLWILRR